MRGGVTPPIPPGTTAAQVFTDAGCTTRPVAGGIYGTLYVRLNHDFGYGDYTVYESGAGDLNNMIVIAPNSEDPGISYGVQLWIDWISAEFDTPFTAGSVIPVSLVDPQPLPSSFTVDFYDE